MGFYYFRNDAPELLDGLDSRGRGVFVLLEALPFILYKFIFLVPALLGNCFLCWDRWKGT